MAHDALATSLHSLSDPDLCRELLRTLESELRNSHSSLRFMEVCGTHTVSIFRSGLRSLLPVSVTHLSGPGCPVCVTHEREVAAFIKLAAEPGIIIATFGDLMRVPGPGGQSLKKAKAAGADVRIIYSPLNALEIATQNPKRKVVFLGVGFETTAPTVAATIRMAASSDLHNFFVLSFHKLVPPALRALLSEDSASLDAFLLPGHVSTVLGLKPYRFVASEFGKPGVVGGFEPADILEALIILARLQNEGTADIVNAYGRAVSDTGNPKARAIMDDVFAPADALWRGLGLIPQSGLTLRDAYADFDAAKAFGLEELPDVPETRGCRCGDVLRGRLQPSECPLFGKACAPVSPVGPCMVSTEGSCAAYYKYGLL